MCSLSPLADRLRGEGRGEGESPSTALVESPLTRIAEAVRPLSMRGVVNASWNDSGYCGVMVSFTAATSWLKVNGFGRKANCWFSGRLFSKASSA